MKRVLIPIFFLCLGFAAPIFADSLMYMDDAGNLNFVESPGQVPPQYRYQLTPKPKKVYVDEKTRKKMLKDAETLKKKREAEERKKQKEEERERRLEEKRAHNAEKEREKKERAKDSYFAPPARPSSPPSKS